MHYNRAFGRISVAYTSHVPPPAYASPENRELLGKLEGTTPSESAPAAVAPARTPLTRGSGWERTRGALVLCGASPGLVGGRGAEEVSREGTAATPTTGRGPSSTAGSPPGSRPASPWT